MTDKFLITIMNLNISDKFELFCKNNNLDYYVMYGKGSAKKSLWSLLGLVDNKKAIYLLDDEEKYKSIINYINSEKKEDYFLAQIGGNMTKERLFLCIVNSGFADEVMDIARASGATGGTILDARGTGKNTDYIMGSEVDSAKEIVMIFCNEEIAKTLEEKIGEFINSHNNVSGICFTLNAKLFKELNVDGY